MIDEDFDLKIISTDRRFSEVSIGITGLATTAAGPAAGVFGWPKLG